MALCKSTFIDPRDGQEYPTVEIGGTVWMAANLNFVCPDSWPYENDKNNALTHGRLYTFPSAQQASPPGWHLPSKTEWEDLVTAVGGVGHAGSVLKSKEEWVYGSHGTDEFGFGLLPAGCRYSGGSYFYQGFYAGFWTSTEYGTAYAYNRYLFYFFTDLDIGFGSRFNGLSVRCVQDKP